jgi:hypothetical protein
MFEKVIEFIAPQDYVDQKQDLPTPIKINIPDWFKKLNHSMEKRSIKGCIPFLETLTFGYSLYVPVDLKIHHNVTVKDKEGKIKKDSLFGCPLEKDVYNHGININYNGMDQSTHSVRQVEGSPFVDKNKKLPFYKILNPWKIKTPAGYSCLFLPPLNNTDDRFSIIPGIVDTDSFDSEINFPIIINGDKYEVLDTVIKKGTPYVQIIPFKRDDWKMKISGSNIARNSIRKMLYPLRLIHSYKTDIWKKKQCQ